MMKYVLSDLTGRSEDKTFVLVSSDLCHCLLSSADEGSIAVSKMQDGTIGILKTTNLMRIALKVGQGKVTKMAVESVKDGIKMNIAVKGIIAEWKMPEAINIKYDLIEGGEKAETCWIRIQGA
jgi:hypothetical protein